MHCPNAVEMIECIVNLLALFTDKRLDKTTIVIHADHCRNVALQLRHLAWSPRREIAKRHLIALADDIIQFVEHLEIDIVDLLHLMFQHLWLHHRIQQHLIRSLDGCEHVKTFHQVGHAHIIMSLCLRLTGLQQFLMQQVVRMLRIEHDIISIVRIRMNPYGILASFEHATEDGCQRTRSQLGIRHRQHIGHQRRVCHIPIQVFCSPLRVKPPLVQVTIGRGSRDVGMGLYTLLKMLPHIQNDTLMVPPVDIVFLCLFKILFPSIHITDLRFNNRFLRVDKGKEHRTHDEHHGYHVERQVVVARLQSHGRVYTNYVNHFFEFVLVVCYVQFLLLLDMDILLRERNLNAVLVEGVVDAAEHFADDIRLLGCLGPDEHLDVDA